MMNIKINWKSWLIILFVLLLAAACTSSTGEGAATDAEETEHGHEDDEDEHDEDKQHGRVPNNGAIIRIVSPADGAVISVDEGVVVEIEVENFELGVDGNHWHVYVDDESWGMVMGQNRNQPLHGLEPGTHRIEVVLSNSGHEDLQDGDTIEITVEE